MFTCLEKPYNKKISSISLNNNKRNSQKTVVAKWTPLRVLLLQCIFTINFIQSIALIDSGGVHLSSVHHLSFLFGWTKHF